MDKENRREVTISEHKKLNNLIKGNNFSKKNYIGYFLIIIGVLFVVFGTTYKISSDGVVRYDFLVNLLEYGTIDKMKYSFYGPFFASPLYFVNHNFVKYYNVLLFIISSFISFKILYKHIGKEFAINFILLLFAGSMFTYHIRDFFGEIFSTCLFFLGLLYLIFEKKNIIASILLALAVANTPAMVVPLFIFLLYWIVVTRNLKYLIILFSAIALMLIENVVKYHSLLNQDYGSAYEHGIKTLLPYSGFPGFSYPMFYGILSIFLSFGKGLVFFSSGILLFFMNRPEKDIKKMYFSLFLVGIGLVLIYAKWWAWYGGVYWGPRFFLFFSIISSFIIAYTLTRSVKSFSISTSFIILFVVALSLYVGFNGHTINSNWWEICVKDNYQYEAFSWYVPEFSVLWHPFTTGQVINSTYDIFFSVYIVVVFVYLTIEHHFRILDYCYSKIISCIKSTNKG